MTVFKHTKKEKRAEDKFSEKLEAKGWSVLHRGWPDFFCASPDGEIIFVEVKSSKSEPLNEEQHYVITKLSKLGLKCYRWNPDDGFHRITPTTSRLISLNSEREPNDRRRLTREARLARYSSEEQAKILDDEVNGVLRYW